MILLSSVANGDRVGIKSMRMSKSGLRNGASSVSNCINKMIAGAALFKAVIKSVAPASPESPKSPGTGPATATLIEATEKINLIKFILIKFH